jgi:hypothetical protein
VVLSPVCSLLLDLEMRFVVDLRLLAGQHHAGVLQDPVQQLLLNCLWRLDDTVL